MVIKNFGPEINLFVDNPQIIEQQCMRSCLWGKATTWERSVTWKDNQELEYGPGPANWPFSALGSSIQP